MLFDLRSPGRKRMVQVVYLLLAVVLVGGTILFGVGTGLPGVFGGNSNNNGSNQSLSDQNRDRVDTLDARVEKNPRDARSLAQLAGVHYQLGNSEIGEDATTAGPAAKAEFAKAASAWQRYLALKPDPVDQRILKRMVTMFSPAYLNRPVPWADAQGLVVQEAEAEAERDKTDVPVETYVTLLQAQYAAKRERPARLTADKLREITPKSQQKALEATIALAKNPKDQKAQAALAEATQNGGVQNGGTVTLPDEATTTGAKPPSGTTTTKK